EVSQILAWLPRRRPGLRAFELFADCMHALDNQFIDGLDMAAPQFFLHQPFRLRFELDRHAFNLAVSRVTRKSRFSRPHIWPIAPPPRCNSNLSGGLHRAPLSGASTVAALSFPAELA